MNDLDNEAFRIRIRKLIKKRKNEKEKLIKQVSPRYDEVYFEGVKLLDSS